MDAGANDTTLTHSGPGTPCGKYLRRYWHPFLLASELKDTPIALKIMGEDLVIYRDHSGKIGLLHKHCAHRGTSLEFGIPSERGIRCCYHGWLFDADGTILETPAEPPNSRIKDNFRQLAYPVREVHGLLFTYMGPAGEEPAFPLLDTLANQPGEQSVPFRLDMPCNWVQVVENACDPIHNAYLHAIVSSQFANSFRVLPALDFIETPLGFLSMATRRVKDFVFVRASDIILPNVGQFIAAAQDFPTRLIRIVVAYPAGGGTDSVARPIAAKLSDLVGKPVIIENRPGANSIVGTDYVTKSPPDGYTLLINSASQLLIPFYNANVPYNAVGDFTPIVKIGINRRVIVVNPDLPIRNLRDLIDYSKKNQGKLSCGVAAAGSAQELAGDILKAETGMDFVSVPFRGGANAVQGLLSGDIGMAILILGDVVELVRAGKLRAVAIVDGDRAKIAPDVPSLAESGITMVPEQWVGLLGPRGLPETVTASLNASVNKTLAEPQVRRSLETLGYDIVGGTPEAFGTQMKDNVELYRKLTDKLGIKPK